MRHEKHIYMQHATLKFHNPDKHQLHLKFQKLSASLNSQLTIGKIIHRVKLYRIVINAHIIKFMPFLRQLPILVFAFCEVLPGRLTMCHLTICARYLLQKFHLKLINKVK